MYKLSDFSYHLPSRLIANSPAIPRDSARLMVVNRRNLSISHALVRDLPYILPRTYRLVVNNTKVFPARIFGTKTSGGKVEVLLLEKTSTNSLSVISKPGIKTGEQLHFPNGLSAICTDVSGMSRSLQFNLSGPALLRKLRVIGEVPTPPYINPSPRSRRNYQTVYARKGFSAAAPTAGLHFTKALLAKLRLTHGVSELTLNVGLGTFLPVREQDISRHHLHNESYTITAQLARELNLAKRSDKKILAVGTTTTRALESAVQHSPTFRKTQAATDIFIYPPYRFKAVDALLTNFHLPESSLLMLVSAFTSSPNTKEKFESYQQSLIGKCYTEAIKNNYRFYSFGDAMLIL